MVSKPNKTNLQGPLILRHTKDDGWAFGHSVVCPQLVIIQVGVVGRFLFWDRRVTIEKLQNWRPWGNRNFPVLSQADI